MQKSGHHRKKRTCGAWSGFNLGELRDERKFESFVNQTYDLLFGFAYQLLGNMDDAKDIVQTVFLELWELVNRRLRNPDANAITFAYQLVKLRAYDFREKQTLSLNPEWVEEIVAEETFDGELPSHEHESDVLNVEGIVIAIEKRKVIYECVNQLEGNTREAFFLFWQGFSRTEIAKNLDVSAARVSQLLKIAFFQLRRKLQEMGYDCSETIGVPLKF